MESAMIAALGGGGSGGGEGQGQGQDEGGAGPALFGDDGRLIGFASSAKRKR